MFLTKKTLNRLCSLHAWFLLVWLKRKSINPFCRMCRLCDGSLTPVTKISSVFLFFSALINLTSGNAFHTVSCCNSVMTNNNTIFRDFISANRWRILLQKAVQCTLRKPCVGRDWQRHYSILGTLPFRDYSDVTLIPLHGWMLKNYRATNNSTSRVHILQVLRYPLSLLQLTQQHFFFFALNDA